MKEKKGIKTTILICAVVLFFVNKAFISAYAVEESGSLAEEETSVGEKASEEGETEQEESVPVRLQVPQKFDIALDPWEMDRRGQIYSEEYTIKNLSGTKGTLQLTGIAVGQGENVAICPNGDSIHSGNARNVLIEMIINGEEGVTLSPEGSEYKIILEANEAVTLTFTGRLNENAENGWHDNDLEIVVVYDWVPETEEDSAEGSIISEENSAEAESTVEGNSAETGNTAEGNSVDEESNRTETENTSSEEDDTEGNETENTNTELIGEETEITGNAAGMEEGEGAEASVPESSVREEEAHNIGNTGDDSAKETGKEDENKE